MPLSRDKMNKREKKLLSFINMIGKETYFGIDQDGQVVAFDAKAFKISENGSHWYRGRGNARAIFLGGISASTKGFKKGGWRNKVYRVEDSKLIVYKKNKMGIFCARKPVDSEVVA